MTDPFFSVVIPTCNRDEMLRRALDSVLAQSFADFEIIVVDNAGNSRLPGEFEAAGDGRVRFDRYTEKRGAASARNRGLQLARGGYVCFLDDDDEYLPRMLESVHQLVEEAPNGPVDFCWCGSEKRFYRGNNLLRVANYLVSPGSVNDRSFVLRIGTGSGFCADRGALSAVGGFDETMRVSEDRDLVLKLLENGYRGEPLARVLHRRYYHDAERLSTSQSIAEDARHDYMLLEKHSDYLRRYPALRNKLLDQLAQNYRLAGEIARARSIAFEAWRSNPFRLKAIRRLLRYALLGLFAGGSAARSNR